MAATFEECQKEIAAIPQSPSGKDRDVAWFDARRELGIAISADGCPELYLKGNISPRSALMRRHTELNQDWQAGEEGFRASRISLPPGEPFRTVAALILFELLKALDAYGGVVERAFEEAEPYIELVLHQATVADEVIFGLVGELLTLEALLLSVQMGDRSSVLDCWHGYRREPRDFILDDAGLEVKTSMSGEPVHRISSLRQTERAAGEAAGPFLLSIGLEIVGIGGSTLPEKVDRILELLDGPREPSSWSQLQWRFLRQVRDYGGGAAGYDHSEMQEWHVFRRRFDSSYTPRLYDLSDPHLRMLRREHLAGTIVLERGLTYEARLPDTVSEGNPTRDWQVSIGQMLATHLDGG
jgi:hypothetical protein